MDRNGSTEVASLGNMLSICLSFLESELRYAYKRYAYKEKRVYALSSKLTNILSFFYKVNPRLVHADMFHLWKIYGKFLSRCITFSRK